jgi:hypothetical protein
MYRIRELISVATHTFTFTGVILKRIKSYLIIAFFFLYPRVSPAQDGQISEQKKDAVFNAYASYLDNALKVHEIGFSAIVVQDYDKDSPSLVMPKNYRRYGMMADKNNGKFRRIENCGWTIGEVGIEWNQGVRVICRDGKLFYQGDPTPMAENTIFDFNKHLIGNQVLFSPFGIVVMPSGAVTLRRATPDGITRWIDESTLVGAMEDNDVIDCLYLHTNEKAAFRFVYSKKQGGMITMFENLYRGDEVGKQKSEKLVSKDPKQILKWRQLVKILTSWEKIDNYYVPSLVDHIELTPAYSIHNQRYFLDWKIGKDVDMGIFDPEKVGGKPPATMKVTAEYSQRQKELDKKVLDLTNRLK